MKTFARDILLSFLLGVVVPAMILGILIGLEEKEPVLPETGTTEPVVTISSILRPQVKIPVMMDDGTTEQMELETYLRGVVLSEMPADFELEALKAQAVVARTYALRRLSVGTKHTSGAVCTDPSCCQGYISDSDYIDKGGSGKDISKISRAVLMTAGEVILYGDKLIDATYFSCSGGRTEAAVAVWGSDVPYLQATDSPGEEAAAHYTDTAVFTASEIENALGVTLEGTAEDWFTVLSLTDGGSVDKIDICGHIFTGVEMRKALSLRSAAFTVTADEDDVCFETRGYGHRVGMSQYGADAMATAGGTYSQILEHYYQGTSIAKYRPDD